MKNPVTRQGHDAMRCDSGNLVDKLSWVAVKITSYLRWLVAWVGDVAITIPPFVYSGT